MSSRRLRLCVVGESHQVHVRARARCFAELGHDVAILTDRLSGQHGLTELVAKPLPDLPKLRVVGALVAHARKLRAFRPDVVHVHFAYRIPAWLVGILEPHPLVVSLMGGDVFFEERGQVSPRRRRLTSHLLAAADWVTAKSEGLIAGADRLAPVAHKATKVTWGIDRGLFGRRDVSSLRAELALPAGAPLILSCRNLRPLYNIHLLIRAMPFVLRRHPNAKLLVLEANADPAYREELLRLVGEASLSDSVRFLPAVGIEAMAAYYSLATVVVSVPSSDGLPQTLLEAQACGAPLLLSRLPSYAKAVLDGEDGLLVDLASESIARGLSALLGDEGLRDRLSTLGPRRAAAVPSLHDQAKLVEGEYQRLQGLPIRRQGATARARALVAYLLLGLERRR